MATSSNNSNLVLETKLFNLSTRGSACNLLNGENKSHVEYSIPDMIVRDDESIEYIQFSIPYAVIPVSFYGVNENNNMLSLNDGIDRLINFPYGNYNVSTFISKFVELLGSEWSLKLNTFNSIFTVTNSLHSFTFYTISTIDSVMGFSTDLSSSLVNGVHTLTLTRTCNFLPLPRVCIRCSELITNNHMVGASRSSDIIITIPNNSKPNGQLYYQNQTQIKSLYRGNSISRIVISLTDDDGNFLNFNGVSSFFVLQFDIYRLFVPKLPSFSNLLNMVNSKALYYPNDEIVDASE
jgi:hypothetical protein